MNFTYIQPGYGLPIRLRRYCTGAHTSHYRSRVYTNAYPQVRPSATKWRVIAPTRRMGKPWRPTLLSRSYKRLHRTPYEWNQGRVFGG